MKRLIVKTLIVFLALLWSSGATAQTINTTAGTVTSCPGEILIPVNVTNCNGIGAISLVLNFNTAYLTYLGYTNLNPSLATGLLIINATANKVVISWANTTAANIGNATLVSLRFTASTGNSNLTWDLLTPGNCEYSNVAGNILPASFTNGTATIQQLPAITGHPIDRNILVGQNTTFSVAATGTGLGYWWQVSTNGGVAWSDLANGGIYSGVTGSILYLTNVSLGYNGYQYRCRVSGTCPPLLISDTAALSVVNPVTTTLPTFNSCPGSIVVPVGVTNFTSISSFSLTCSFDTSSLTYTGYQLLNPALSGGSFLINRSGNKIYMTWAHTTPSTFGNGTIIELLFTNVAGLSLLAWDLAIPGNCEYSGPAGDPLTAVWVGGSHTTYSLPAVVTNPVNRIIAKGQNTTFSASGSGSGIAYRWQVSTDGGGLFSDLSNGGVYSSVTSSTLNITSATLGMSGYQYRCRISGTCLPQVFSDAALLTVLPNIVTTCPTITACPGPVVVPVTVNDFIGVGAFSLVLNFNPAVVTYTGYQNLHSSLSAGTFLANASAGKIYLTWTNTLAATIPNGGTLIELTFTGVPGSGALTWDTQATGNCEYSDVNGLIIFSTWVNGNTSINTPPSIANHPVNRTIYGGGSTTFAVTAAGTGLVYSWQVSTNGGANWGPLVNVSPYSGVSTSTLTINPAAVAMNGNLYRCSVTGTCPPAAPSNHALLTVTPLAITTSIANVTNSCTANLDLPVNVTNCNNVGAISLVLQYDTTKLTFDSYYGVHNDLQNGIFIVNRVGNRVFMSWASTTAANVGTGTLFRYRFRANPSISTTLSWDTQQLGYCEYTDNSGNIITSFYTNATASVIANPLLVNAGTDIGTPYGVPVTLNGTATGGVAPYAYLWSPSTWLSNPAISNPVATPPASTTYTLTVTGQNGCAGSDPMRVNIIVPATLTLQNINIPDGESVCYDATQVITVAGSGTFFTVQNGGSVTMIAGQRISYLPGTKVFTGGYLHGYITTSNQYCFTLPPVAPAVVITGDTYPKLQPASGTSWKVYPNPTSGRFTLEFTGTDSGLPVTADIYNSMGEKVLSTEFRNDRKHDLEIPAIGAGIYFIHLKGSANTAVLKLIKNE